MGVNEYVISISNAQAVRADADVERVVARSPGMKLSLVAPVSCQG